MTNQNQLDLQNGKVQTQSAQELLELITTLEEESPDEMPMILPNSQEMHDLMDRWMNGAPEMWKRFQKAGTLELQAQYRMMLMTKQMMLDRRPDAATRAERDQLLLL